MKTMLGIVERMLKDTKIPRAQLPGRLQSVFMDFLKDKPLGETLAAAVTLRGRFLREPVFTALAGELIRQSAFNKALQVMEAYENEPKSEDEEENTPVRRHAVPQPDIMPKISLLVALWEKAKRYSLTAGGNLRSALLVGLGGLKPEEVAGFFREASNGAKDGKEREQLEEFREMLVHAIAMRLAEEKKATS